MMEKRNVVEVKRTPGFEKQAEFDELEHTAVDLFNRSEVKLIEPKRIKEDINGIR